MAWSNEKLSALYNERIGQTKILKNGLKATIIEYYSATNISVQFENGAIVKNREYNEFKNGYIKCPLILESFGNYYKIINPNPKKKTEFLIDIEDLEKVLNVGLWYISTGGYITSRINDKDINLHVFLMNPPDDMTVDHNNNNVKDCRKSNLRICTQAENNRNASLRKDNTSGFKGVSWHIKRNKWFAKIRFNGKVMQSKFYDCKIEAAKAYNEMAIKYHGEFAKLNIISD